MVGADPARRVAQTVEGPTLHDREIEFGRGIASSDRSPTCFGRSSRASALVSGPGRSARRARRAVGSAAALLALALVTSGCGGAAAADPAASATPGASTDGTAIAGTTPAATGTTGAAASGTGAAADVPGANEIANADASAGELLTVSAMTPKKFKQAFCSKPIMVVYYQPGSIVDEKLLAEATAAAGLVKGAGLVTLAYTPKDVKAFGDLGSKLGLFSTPGLATVGRDGRIENFWTSYVDHALIERSLRNAAASHACKVGGDDVPAPGSALADATTVANGGTVKGATSDPLTGTPPGTPAVDAAAANTGGVTGGVNEANAIAGAENANLAATTTAGAS
jgi:hypothetical protein